MNAEDGLRELGYKPETLRGNPLAEPLGNMGLLQKQALETIAARDERIAELEGLLLKWHAFAFVGAMTGDLHEELCNDTKEAIADVIADYEARAALEGTGDET